MTLKARFLRWLSRALVLEGKIMSSILETNEWCSFEAWSATLTGRVEHIERAVGNDEKISDPIACPDCGRRGQGLVMPLLVLDASHPERQRIVGAALTCPHHEVPFGFFWMRDPVTNQVHVWSNTAGRRVTRGATGGTEVVDVEPDQQDARRPRLRTMRP